MVDHTVRAAWRRRKARAPTATQAHTEHSVSHTGAQRNKGTGPEAQRHTGTATHGLRFAECIVVQNYRFSQPIVAMAKEKSILRKQNARFVPN